MIKYLDLQKINASFEPELSDALLRVSHSGWYLHGEATARFEEEFAAYCGTSYCVGTGNGLDALTLIFLAYRELGVMNAGDEGYCSCQYIHCHPAFHSSCRPEANAL